MLLSPSLRSGDKLRIRRNKTLSHSYRNILLLNTFKNMQKNKHTDHIIIGNFNIGTYKDDAESIEFQINMLEYCYIPYFNGFIRKSRVRKTMC